MTTYDEAGADPGGPDLADLVSRTEGMQPWRRAFHAFNGCVLALAPGALELSTPTVVGLLSGVLALVLALDLIRLNVPKLNAAFFEAFSSLASPREASALASSTWYTLGVLLTYAFFPRPAVVPAVLVLGLADPAASLVGRAWGRRPLGKGSWVGAATFFVTASLILVAATGEVRALGVALAVAGMEVLPVPVDDNLTIPLATAALLVLFVGG